MTDISRRRAYKDLECSPEIKRPSKYRDDQGINDLDVLVSGVSSIHLQRKTPPIDSLSVANGTRSKGYALTTPIEANAPVLPAQKTNAIFAKPNVDSSKGRFQGDQAEFSDADALTKTTEILTTSTAISTTYSDQFRSLEIKEMILKENEKGEDLYNALKITFRSIENSKDLKVLDLSGLKLDKLDLELVFNFFKNLEELDLSGAKISDEFLKLIAQEGTSLKKLDLNNCTEDSSSIVSEEFFDGFNLLEDLELTSLSLENAPFLRYNHIIQISCLPKLEYLNLSGNKRLLEKYAKVEGTSYDLAFQEICDLLKNLEFLQAIAITGWDITGDLSERLRETLPSLFLRMCTRDSSGTPVKLQLETPPTNKTSIEDYKTPRGSPAKTSIEDYKTPRGS
jgi:hypothetical protein